MGWRWPWKGGQWWGGSRWERGYTQAVGVSSVSYFFIYFPTVPGRGGHGGWEEVVGGRRDRKGGARALSETSGRQASARLCWARQRRG